MSTVKLHAGVELHNMSPDEFRRLLAEESALQRAAAVTIKWMRLPETLQGKASGGALLLNSATSPLILGPRSGYFWSCMRLVVDGLTSGGSPDVVNLYRNDNTLAAPLWQFNGNNFGYTFSRMQIGIDSGDWFTLANAPGTTISSTSTIRLSGEVLEIASERKGEFA